MYGEMTCCNLTIFFIDFFQPWQPNPELESTRSVIETEVTAYTLNHYKHGICSVFSVVNDEGNSIVACIEDHQFQPKNLW